MTDQLPPPCDHPPLYEQDGICWLCEEFAGQEDALQLLQEYQK